MNRNKIRVALGVLAFASLAVLNFTQSERSFVNGTLASSDESWLSSTFSTVVNWVSSILWDQKQYKCNTRHCESQSSIKISVGIEAHVGDSIIGGSAHAGVDYENTTSRNSVEGFCDNGNEMYMCFDWTCSPSC